MRPMKIEENGAGFEVDEILNDLAQGHESVHSNHNLNMIDLNGVEIDEIIKHTRRGVRWNDDNNDVVNIPPDNDGGGEEDVRDVGPSSLEVDGPRSRLVSFGLRGTGRRRVRRRLRHQSILPVVGGDRLLLHDGGGGRRNSILQSHLHARGGVAKRRADR